MIAMTDFHGCVFWAVVGVLWAAKVVFFDPRVVRRQARHEVLWARQMVIAAHNLCVLEGASMMLARAYLYDAQRAYTEGNYACARHFAVLCVNRFNVLASVDYQMVCETAHPGFYKHHNNPNHPLAKEELVYV